MMYEVFSGMDEKLFFEKFPERPKGSHKGAFGKILLISGSYGMAGAACLSITGAKAIGAQYINVALPEDIYGIVASRHITPVYYPYYSGANNTEFNGGPQTISALLPNVRAVCFGSGADNNKSALAIFNTLLKGCRVPLVLDAKALRLIKQFDADLREFSCPVILTPHQGEFSALADVPLAEVIEDPVSCAAAYAAEKGVIMVLKGPHTAVAAPDGRYYYNDSGNNALAQAGSGDVLAGMMTAMCSFFEDPFEAACMAVFFHGHIADVGIRTHSRQCFPLEEYVSIADGIFFDQGR